MNVLELILEKLDDQKTRTVDDIATGNRSFDEYKYSCGVVRGLLIAAELIKDLEEQMEKSDDWRWDSYRHKPR